MEIKSFNNYISCSKIYYKNEKYYNLIQNPSFGGQTFEFD